ncbi:transposase [Streptomyces albireticuli]|uniref:transposase n=1 Tax=Streptomyces albireticuli TaxID=1940 RepID=UPI000B44AC5F
MKVVSKPRELPDERSHSTPDHKEQGKRGSKLHVLSEAQGIPLAVAVSGANVHDSQAFKPLLLGLPAIRSRCGPRRRRTVKVRADKAYFSAEHLARLRSRGLIPRIARPASGTDVRTARVPADRPRRTQLAGERGVMPALVREIWGCFCLAVSR